MSDLAFVVRPNAKRLQTLLQLDGVFALPFRRSLADRGVVQLRADDNRILLNAFDRVPEGWVVLADHLSEPIVPTFAQVVCTTLTMERRMMLVPCVRLVLL